MAEQQVGKSLDEIAALMAANRRAMAGDTDEDQTATQLGDDDDDADSAEQPDEDVGAEVRDDQDAGADDADDEDQDDDEAGADEDEGEADDEPDFELDDDTLVEIEGLDEPVSFKQLKDVYQADKTLPERLQAIEATYTEVAQTRSKTLEEGQKVADAMQAVIKAVDSVIAQPLVSEPDARLRTSNPEKYWQHYDAYQQDQQRIKDSRQAVLDALDAHSNHMKEYHENSKQHAMAVLAQKIPALKDEGTRTEASKDILDAAEFYGFSKDEVNAAADARIFAMAYDAQQYRKLKQAGSKKEDTVTKIKKKVGQQPKVLRSKNTSAKDVASTAQKRIKVLQSRAAKSGKPEDVAAFMSARRAIAP